MASRRTWPVRLVPLGAEPPDRLDRRTTAKERLALLWSLAVEAWTLSGRADAGVPTDPGARPAPPARSPQPRDARGNEDFQDVLAALLASGARFLVVGAHALAVHGVLRATGDLDIWILAEPANAERVRETLIRSTRATGRLRALADPERLEAEGT